MADKALKKLRHQLQCTVCLDIYTDPKLLQCNHVYCQKCLLKLVIHGRRGQLTLTCPICRYITPVPPGNGVAGLQSAFHINYLLEIQESFKKIGEIPTTPTSSAVKGAIESEERAKHCSEHKEDLRLYCDTCEALICFQCAIKGGKHHSHEYELLEKAFQKYKDEIASSLEPIKEQVQETHKSLAQLDECCGMITNQQETIEADIQDSVRQLHEYIDTRKMELIDQLHQKTQAKLKDLAIQKEQVKATQSQLSSCLEILEESSQGSHQGELIMAKKELAQIKHLASSMKLQDVNTLDSRLKYFLSADVTALCQNYGSVVASNVDPSECSLVGVITKVVAVGKKSSLLLQTVDLRGELYKETIESIECELVSEVVGTRVKGDAQRRGKSQYEINFTPTLKGKHQLHVKVEGEHVKDSPLFISAIAPPEEIGAPLLHIQNTGTPVGVAVDQKGGFVVTEWAKASISIFRSNGERLRAFGDRGTSNGSFKFPRGVAVDSKGHIIVADSNNNRVQKFSMEGEFVKAMSIRDRHGTPVSPSAIAINFANSKIYITTSSNYVQILNSDLTYFNTFGKSGKDNGEFNHPSGIACDCSGCVYVSDSGNHRVQVFTSRGQFLRVFGKHGKEEGKMDWPMCVAVDSNGLVYVTDSRNSRVAVFEPEGQHVLSFGKKGAGPGEFQVPQGIAVDSSGVVYVCDGKSNSVQLF